MYDRDRIEDVSEALSKLRYNEMLSLGNLLFDIADGREGFTSPAKLSGTAFADLLADWSASVEDNIAEVEES